MKTFELSTKKNKNGKRHFKLILHKIHDDSCIDEVKKAGLEYNLNGITWIKRYCENALATIPGMSLRVAFLDENRTEISGHGETGICSDGLPTFEDATVIGTFTKGYIDEIKTDNGIITACIGEGEIDAMCYHNLITKLEEDASNGIYPSCSVEIMKTEDNNGIIYEYGYKDFGRIVKEFMYSGCALLNCHPADNDAKLIELNNKEEISRMTDVEIKELVAQVVNEMRKYDVELEQCRKDCENKISALNSELENANNSKDEAVALAEQIKNSLDESENKNAELSKKYDELCAKCGELEKNLNDANAKERMGELNKAIGEFTDSEKQYAETEINAFNSDPINSEINVIINKIWEGIGKKSREIATIVEQNSASNNACEDIFCMIESTVSRDNNIF